jgi:hypothetical protein
MTLKLNLVATPVQLLELEHLVLFHRLQTEPNIRFLFMRQMMQVVVGYLHLKH